MRSFIRRRHRRMNAPTRRYSLARCIRDSSNYTKENQLATRTTSILSSCSHDIGDRRYRPRSGGDCGRRHCISDGDTGAVEASNGDTDDVDSGNLDTDGGRKRRIPDKRGEPGRAGNARGRPHPDRRSVHNRG